MYPLTFMVLWYEWLCITLKHLHEVNLSLLLLIYYLLCCAQVCLPVHPGQWQSDRLLGARTHLPPQQANGYRGHPQRGEKDFHTRVNNNIQLNYCFLWEQWVALFIYKIKWTYWRVGGENRHRYYEKNLNVSKSEIAFLFQVKNYLTCKQT